MKYRCLFLLLSSFYFLSFLSIFTIPFWEKEIATPSPLRTQPINQSRSQNRLFFLSLTFPVYLLLPDPQPLGRKKNQRCSQSTY